MVHRTGTLAPAAALLAAAGALLVVLAACASTVNAAGGGSQTGSSASCAATLKFRGRVYGGSSLRTHPPYTWVARISAAHMHEIGTGEFPPCRDTNHSNTDQAQSVRVARIDGVDPAVAVAVLPAGQVFIERPSLAVINSVLKSARGIRWEYSS